MKPLTGSILPQIALNQNPVNTFTNNSSNFNSLVTTSKSTTYLEPHLAAKTLKNLTRGFFTNPRPMAIKAAAGSGKTSSIIQCLNSGFAKGKEVHFYVPTLELGYEVSQKIYDSVVIEGRNEKNCQRHEIAAELGTKGLPVYNSICSSKVKDENGNVTTVNCPFYAECAYIKQFSQSKVKIMTHAFLAQNHGALETKADLAIFDEKFFDLVIGSMALMPIKDLFELDKLGKLKTQLIIALDALAQGQCTNLLSEFSIEAREALGGDIRKLLNSLDNKFDNTKLNPAMSDKMIAFQVKNIRSHTKEISILKALLFELEQFELNPNQPNRLIKTATSAEGIKLFSINFLKTDNRLNYFKRHKTPVLCIDASADSMILNTFFDDLEFHTIDVKRNAHVTQVTGSQYSKSRFFYNDEDGKNLENLVTNLTKATGNKKALVATYKDLETKLKGQLPENMATVHFNALRGIDKYKDFDTVFVVGRNQPPMADMENIAAALFSRSDNPIQYNQEPVKIDGNYYSQDERVNAVMRQFRECEALQAIDRLRLVHNIDKKEVVLVGNLPLDIEVNRTVKQFKDLNQSFEKKLSGITAECEGLLISSAVFIHERFGYLFKNFDQIKNQISRCKSAYRTFYMENYTMKFFRYVGYSGGHAITFYDTQGRSDAELIAALERVTGRKVELVSDPNELTKVEITEIMEDSLFIDPRIFNNPTFSVKVHVTQPEYFVRE
jgi:hypothetical protein